MTASGQPQPFVQRKRLLIVQILSVAAVLVLLFSKPVWRDVSWADGALKYAGVALILACVFGRLWSILFVGGHKNTELVTEGPYSVTRNPLYLFSTIGIFGIGLVFGSVVIALIFGGLSYLIFTVTGQKEGAFLRGHFGDKYRAYEASTPAFWPNIKLFHQPDDVTFSPVALQRTFVDAMYFILMIPVIEGVKYLQVSGYLPTFIWIP